MIIKDQSGYVWGFKPCLRLSDLIAAGNIISTPTELTEKGIIVRREKKALEFYAMADDGNAWELYDTITLRK